MATIKIFDLIPKRMLVTRETARGIWPELRRAIAQSEDDITLDFQEIRGVTPSFLDEVLAMVGELAGNRKAIRVRIKVVNPPAELSTVHSAIARTHGLTMSTSTGGAWIITPSEGVPSSES